MREKTLNSRIIGYWVLFLLYMMPAFTLACSTFKLQSGDKLVYGHNLNQGDIGVPGLLFINPRGVYKTGITWTELTTNAGQTNSPHSWVSRYGSVSFNCFGKNLPDGGMNESGLVIWEMSDDIEYPKNDSLPRLCQMNWIQYILDNCSTLDEAVQCAYQFQIDGWGWHYFIGDSQGNTAAVAFHDGQVVVDQGKNMPVPALFNSPYEREMELLKFYEGWGGTYPIDIHNPKTPRFVRFARMVDDYKPWKDVVKYGLNMLKNLRVNDDPEWSVLFDPQNMSLHFRTRLNPKVKTLSLSKVDFSNTYPVRILNIDIQKGGNISDKLEVYTNARMHTFTRDFLFPLLPEAFFTNGEITLDEYLNRLSAFSDGPSLAENQFFRGLWEYQKDNGDIVGYDIKTRDDAVIGEVIMSDGKETFRADHFQLVGNHLKFTYLKSDGRLIEVRGKLLGDKMSVSLHGIEDFYGNYVFTRKTG